LLKKCKTIDNNKVIQEDLVNITGSKLIVQGYVVKEANQLERFIEDRRTKLNI